MSRIAVVTVLSFACGLTVLTGQSAVPGPPGSLMFAVTGSTVTLTWTPPVSGGVPTSYVVEAGSSPGARDIADVVTNSLNTGLSATAPPGVYHVRVRASNAAGRGEPSNEVLIVVGGAAPCVPP